MIAFDMYVHKHPIKLLIGLNILHLVMELNENDRCQNNPNITLESTPNHKLDIMMFFIGSFLGYILVRHTGPRGVVGKLSALFKNHIIAYLLLIVIQATIVYEFWREIARELWPDADTWYLQGAFTENCYHPTRPPLSKSPLQWTSQ